MKSDKKNKINLLSTREIIYAAIFVVIISVCSWISVPSTIPFTLQTLGIFCALGLLGAKTGGIAILAYLLLGLVGVPIFAGFKAGVSAFLGPTGGFLIGFAFCAPIFAIVTRIFGHKTFALIAAFILGQLCCYFTGIIWYVFVFGGATDVNVLSALMICVVPFIIPDIVKIAFSVIIIKTVNNRQLLINTLSDDANNQKF